MPTPDIILDRFAALAQVEVSDLTGAGRSSVITRLRGECMWHMRVLAGATLEQIGAVMGGRKSATVRESIDTLRARLVREPDLAGQLQSMALALRASAEAEPASEAPAPTGLTPDLRLAVVSAILQNPDLTDAEARRAARFIIGLVTSAPEAGHGEF